MEGRGVEERLARAFVEFISKARGRKATVKASTLVRLAGLEERHSYILKAARMLSRLSKAKIVRVEVKDKISRAKSIMYIVDDQMDIWRESKRNPEGALRILLKALEETKGKSTI